MPIRPLTLLTGVLLSVFIAQAQTPSVQYFPLPDTTSVIAHDFNFLCTGTVALPYRGGILLPELGYWLMEPGKNNIVLSALSNQPGSIYTLSLGMRGMELEKRTAMSDTDIRQRSIGIIRQGFFSFYQSPDLKGSYLFGSEKNSAVIYRLTASDELDTLLAIPHTQITAMYCEDPRQILIASGNTVWRYNGSARSRLFELPDPIEGLTGAPDGDLIISTAKGTFRIVAGGPPVCISRHLHGPLHISKNKLYILSLQQNVLACISPGTAGSFIIH